MCVSYTLRMCLALFKVESDVLPSPGRITGKGVFRLTYGLDRRYFYI